MTKPRPIRLKHSQTDLFWPEGPFKMCYLQVSFTAKYRDNIITIYSNKVVRTHLEKIRKCVRI